jgi:hypothetical protein
MEVVKRPRTEVDKSIFKIEMLCSLDPVLEGSLEEMM